MGMSLCFAASNKLSLLIVASFNGKYEGLTGIDAYVSNHARLMQDAGYNVFVVSQQNSGLHRRLQLENVPCAGYDFQAIFAGKDPGDYKAFFKKIVIDRQITHVHCNSVYELSSIHKAVGSLGIKIFYTHHYQSKMVIDKYPFLSGGVVVNKLLVNSKNSITNEGIAPIVFIPPFLDDQRFLSVNVFESAALRNLYGANGPIITMVGNMYNNSSFKNYPLLIKAIAMLNEKYNFPCTALIVGDGPQRDKISKLVTANSKLSSVVNFLGFRRDVPEILAASDLVVLTSKTEGFGMVLAEANMLGKPVVGPNKTGVEGVIEHGINGLLFENDSADDFCQKVIAILSDQEIQKAMGLAARDYASRNFMQHILLGQLLSLYGVSVDK
jgi:glycosyltransferase involved in cell wall biosynthesis